MREPTGDAAITPVAPASTGRPVYSSTRAPEPEPPPAPRIGLTPISLLVTLLVAYLLYQVQLVLVLVLMAIVIATAIERPVELLQARHFPRPLGILLVYATLIAGLALFFTVLAPIIRDQGGIFRDEAPAQLRTLQETWATSSNPLLNGPGQELLANGVNIIEHPDAAGLPMQPEAAIGVVTGVGGGLLSILTVLVITFYYLMEKVWLRRLLMYELPAHARERAAWIWDNVEAKVGDWLRGQLTLCVVIGVVATVGYGILGVPFWPMLGLWAGLTEIIPILGPWLGGIPAFVIALTVSWEKALVVGIFVIAIQFSENMILVPRVMRGAVGLSPMTVFVAILAGTQFLGFAGALLAIPVAAAVQVVVTGYFNARKEAERAAPTSGWRWMRGSAAVTGPVAGPPAPETVTRKTNRARLGGAIARASTIRGNRTDKPGPSSQP